MMLPHRMYLKGPWQYEWLGAPSQSPVQQEITATGPEKPAGRVKMPADWRSIFGDCAGRVRFRRRFGCPTNLQRRERVFIVFEAVGGTARVWLNDQVLGTIEDSTEPAGFDITELLAGNNQLTVELNFDPGDSAGKPGGLWAPVAIEIRSE